MEFNIKSLIDYRKYQLSAEELNFFFHISGGHKRFSKIKALIDGIMNFDL